jgi:hypothetical protein
VRFEIPLEPPSEGFPSAAAVPALIPKRKKVVASNASARFAMLDEGIRTCAQSTSSITRLNLQVEPWPGSGSTEVATPPGVVPSRRCAPDRQDPLHTSTDFGLASEGQ